MDLDVEFAVFAVTTLLFLMSEQFVCSNIYGCAHKLKTNWAAFFAKCYRSQLALLLKAPSWPSWSSGTTYMGKVVRGKRSNSRTSYKMQNKMIYDILTQNFNLVNLCGTRMGDLYFLVVVCFLVLFVWW